MSKASSDTAPVLLSRLTPRQIPLVFHAIPVGLIDIDRSKAWMALKNPSREPLALLLIEAKATGKRGDFGVITMVPLSEDVYELYLPMLKQIEFLARRRNIRYIGFWGGVEETSREYPLLIEGGFVSREHLVAFKLEGKDNIQRIYEDQKNVYEQLKERGSIADSASVVPFKEVSAEAVSQLVSQSLGTARQHLDHNPVSGIDQDRSLVMLDGNRIVAAYLVRILDEGKGFYISSFVIDKDYRMSWASPWISAAFLGGMLEIDCEYYKFETNPDRSPLMMNHAKIYDFEETGKNHFMTKDLLAEKDQAAPAEDSLNPKSAE